MIEAHNGFSESTLVAVLKVAYRLIQIDSTEHTVTKGAIARPAFRGRFVCICWVF